MNETSPIGTDDELLVAYLDGELPRAERDDLENRLIAEESLRLRLQSLQRTWDMLDWLPSQPPSERAVQTTMQLVVADLTADLTSDPTSPQWKSSSGSARSGNKLASAAPQPVPRPARKSAMSMAIALWAVPLAIAACVFATLHWRNLQETRAQIADFPVAFDMDAYAVADNAALVEDLMDFNRLKGVVGGSATPAVEELISPDAPGSLYSYQTSGDLAEPRIVLPDHNQLAESLEKLPQSQRIAALSRWDRFNRLDEPAKAKLRETAARIRSSENPTKMLSTLRQYVRFREQITNETAAKIEGETGAARTAAMDDGIDQVISSIGRSTGRNLSDETIERIDFTIVQIVKERLARATGANERDESARQLFDVIQQRARRGDDPDNPYRAFALFTILRDPKWAQEEGRSFRDGPPMEQVAPLNHRDFDTLQAMLLPQDVNTLNQYVSDPWVQSLILRDWAVEAVRRKIRGRSKSPTLAQQYENMPANQREVLDLLPPEKARKELIEGM